MNFRVSFSVLCLSALASLSSAIGFDVASASVIKVNAPASVAISSSFRDSGSQVATGSGSANEYGYAEPAGSSKWEVASYAGGNVPGIGTATSVNSASAFLTLFNTSASTVTGQVTVDYSLYLSIYDYQPGQGDEARAEAEVSILGSIGNFNKEYSVTQFNEEDYPLTFTGTATFNFSLRPYESRSLLVSTFADGYASAVPEPATMAVLGLGALAVARRRKRA